MLKTLTARMNAHTDKSAGHDRCWIWTGHLTRGYGRLRYQGKALKPHRVAFELANGPIPEGKFVCHACDTPSCVNPAHLFLGTHDENMADMVAKGRCPSLRGEAHPKAKLTDEQRRAIAADSRQPHEVARAYGVSATWAARLQKHGAERQPINGLSQAEYFRAWRRRKKAELVQNGERGS